MEYQLPHELHERIRIWMSVGNYDSESAVLRDALDALEHRELAKSRWDERNRTAISQSESGLSKPLDDKAILARLRKRLAQQQASL